MRISGILWKWDGSAHISHLSIHGNPALLSDAVSAFAFHVSCHTNANDLTIILSCNGWLRNIFYLKVSGLGEDASFSVASFIYYYLLWSADQEFLVQCLCYEVKEEMRKSEFYCRCWWRWGSHAEIESFYLSAWLLQWSLCRGKQKCFVLCLVQTVH